MSKDGDQLGNRMKQFEGIEANRILISGLPICCRLDGKSFSQFSKGLKRPFDVRLTNLMIETSKFLLEKTNARISYCQSDEISLVIYSHSINSEVYFNGRIQKLTSILAGYASAFFTKNLEKYLPEKADKIPVFDCRVWNVPSLSEAANTLVWRELDATKNAISMAAQHYYSHKELHLKNGKEMQEMLFQKGINFNEYPSYFRRGSYIRRVTKSIKYSSEEIERLPSKHEARTNPDLVVERSVIERVELPPIVGVENKIEVLFEGADPIIKNEVTTKMVMDLRDKTNLPLRLCKQSLEKTHGNEEEAIKLLRLCGTPQTKLGRYNETP